MILLHISDLHFGFHEPEIVTTFLEEVHRIAPDLIFISGDITQRAKPSQFREAKQFISTLPCPVLTVPGNHDIPLYNIFRRSIWPFYAYKRYISRSLQVSFENETIRILGLSSVDSGKIKDGTLSPKSLRMIEKFFSTQGKKWNILFFHHNFSYFEGLHKPLENEKEIIEYLKRSTVDIVCTGHLHYANIGTIKRNDGKECTLLHAGSLMCSRSKDKLNSYYQIELSSESLKLEWRVLDGNEFVTRSFS